MRELSEELQRARRVIDGLDGVVEIGGWKWSDAAKHWSLPLRLRHGLAPTALVPAETAWHVVADDSYPDGGLHFHPAIAESIAATFPHQRFNDVNKEQGWRNGRICLTRPSQALGRIGDDDESYDPAGRMRWNVERALEWLRDAAQGQLEHAGDPFELPDFLDAENSEDTVAFQEDGTSFAFWESNRNRFGVVELLSSPRVHLAQSFQTAGGSPLRSVEWGAIGTHAGQRTLGAWILVNAIPVAPPWQAPQTLDELRSMLSALGVDADDVLLKLAERHRKAFRSGGRCLLLLGFPIPPKVGQAPARIHWQALRLPALSSERSPGFRPNAKSLRLRDEKFVLNRTARLDWRRSENWSEDNLTTRGSLEARLRAGRVAIIGAGALGSPIADLLVRGGCNDLALFDDDVFRAGNGVRHVLVMDSVGESKARELAARLNLVRPSVRAQAVAARVPRTRDDKLKLLAQARLVIDATGSDGLLTSLGRIPWEGNPTFVSLSLGYRARRLFCYLSPVGKFEYIAFRAAHDPWLIAEREDRLAAGDLPRDGIGCWAPVFPARADDVWMLAAVAVKWLESAVASNTPSFKVFEQMFDKDGAFVGIREASLPSV
jgi:ThiF family